MVIPLPLDQPNSPNVKDIHIDHYPFLNESIE